jgi:predicted RNA-binding Zn ribbon-like protein
LGRDARHAAGPGKPDRPRKPNRGPTIRPDPLARAATAAQALGLERLETSQLEGLRELHQTVVEFIDGLLAGRSLGRPAARLTKLAQPSTATARIDVDENLAFRTRLEWSDPTPGSMLARRIVLELAEIDATRLRRCDRPACNLVFYDTTRSGTRRWHAESPCGSRERQRRYRAASHTS